MCELAFSGRLKVEPCLGVVVPDGTRDQETGVEAVGVVVEGEATSWEIYWLSGTVGRLSMKATNATTHRRTKRYSQDCWQVNVPCQSFALLVCDRMLLLVVATLQCTD